MPVEKPVEIVEKFGFSTGRPKISNIRTPTFHTETGGYSLP
jgi:hypothetical protein